MVRPATNPPPAMIVVAYPLFADACACAHAPEAVSYITHCYTHWHTSILYDIRCTHARELDALEFSAACFAPASFILLSWLPPVVAVERHKRKHTAAHMLLCTLCKATWQTVCKDYY